MSAPRAPTALIAEDEPLLASALRTELARAWPELEVIATVGDGLSALKLALLHRPDVLLFDIRMPGMNGLDVAAELANEWETGTDRAPFPALVFVTAYDQYAVQAFEAQAMDYLLKPVQAERLQKTVAKLRQAVSTRVMAMPAAGLPDAATDAGLEKTLAQLRSLLAQAAPKAAGSALKVIQVSVGNTIRMVSLEEVSYFEAADKYVRVLTPEHEYLIRTPLRELLPLLDTQQFWQVHRATVVRAGAIEAVTRDEAGKLWLQLRGHGERLAVSRLYAQLFKAM